MTADDTRLTVDALQRIAEALEKSNNLAALQAQISASHMVFDAMSYVKEDRPDTEQTYKTLRDLVDGYDDAIQALAIVAPVQK